MKLFIVIVLAVAAAFAESDLDFHPTLRLKDRLEIFLLEVAQRTDGYPTAKWLPQTNHSCILEKFHTDQKKVLTKPEINRITNIVIPQCVDNPDEYFSDILDFKMKQHQGISIDMVNCAKRILDRFFPSNLLDGFKKDEIQFNEEICKENKQNVASILISTRKFYGDISKLTCGVKTEKSIAKNYLTVLIVENLQCPTTKASEKLKLKDSLMEENGKVYECYEKSLNEEKEATQ